MLVQIELYCLLLLGHILSSSPTTPAIDTALSVLLFSLTAVLLALLAYHAVLHVRQSLRSKQRAWALAKYQASLARKEGGGGGGGGCKEEEAEMVVLPSHRNNSNHSNHSNHSNSSNHSSGQSVG